MKRRLLLLIMTLLLIACSQSVDEPTTLAIETEEIIDDSSENKNNDEAEKKQVDQNKENKEDKSNSNEGLTNLEVHYIDANQADATLFQYTDEKESYTILYDTGDWNRNDVINYLAPLDISFIDLIVISHPHADHNGQLAEIIETYDVGEVWLSGNTASSNTFQRAIEAVLASDADYYEPRTGDTFDIGPLSIDVLHPNTLTGNLNEDSISLLFTYGDIKFVFTGDAYKNEELMMSGKTDVQATILSLGHHGSSTSSDPAFIEAVNPEIAIYSAGANNSYGHPDAEVVSLIQDSGITLYGTDVHGTIVVTTDGNDYTVSTKEDGTISPASTGSSTKGDKTTKPKSKVKETASGDCVNINKASLGELQAIVHIGPARAEELIDRRPFDSVDELSKINGIGPGRIADIKSEGIACVK